MISINNKEIDLIIEVEENTNIKKVLDSLTLDINEVLVICPLLFLQRFIHSIHHSLDSYKIELISNALDNNSTYIDLYFIFKNKRFNFHFIVNYSEIKYINNPTKGTEEYKVAFNIVNI